MRPIDIQIVCLYLQKTRRTIWIEELACVKKTLEHTLVNKHVTQRLRYYNVDLLGQLNLLNFAYKIIILSA